MKMVVHIPVEEYLQMETVPAGFLDRQLLADVHLVTLVLVLKGKKKAIEIPVMSVALKLWAWEGEMVLVTVEVKMAFRHHLQHTCLCYNPQVD